MEKLCKNCGDNISRLRGNGYKYSPSQWKDRKYCSRTCSAGNTPSKDAFDRFIEKVFKVENGCWEWTGSKNERGYGQFWTKEKGNMRAHRYAYEYYKNKILPELQIDHLCRNRSCVNPDHLEAVTARENTMRSNACSSINARKTHCPKGHEYNKENTYRCKGKSGNYFRVCKECSRIRHYEKKRKKRNL